MAGVVRQTPAADGQPVVIDLYKSHALAGDAGTVDVGALPEVEAAADVGGGGGRRVAVAAASLAGRPLRHAARPLAPALRGEKRG